MTWQWAALTTSAAIQRPAPLTSVNQDIAEQGAAAMRMLHAQVCGQTPPRDIRLSSRLVKRRLCGLPGLAAANRRARQ